MYLTTKNAGEYWRPPPLSSSDMACPSLPHRWLVLMPPALSLGHARFLPAALAPALLPLASPRAQPLMSSAISLCPEFDRHELLIYEEVARMPPFRRKTLVLIGAQGVGRRSLKNKLIMWDPDRYGTTVPCEWELGLLGGGQGAGTALGPGLGLLNGHLHGHQVKRYLWL